MNCKREHHPFLIQLYGEHSHYSVEFVTVSSSQLQNTNMILNQIKVEHSQYKQCNNFLTLESDYNKEACCWPSYFIESLKK